MLLYDDAYLVTDVNKILTPKSQLIYRLDWMREKHNFVQVHFTIKQVPAVALERGLSLAELFRIQLPKPIKA